MAWIFASVVLVLLQEKAGEAPSGSRSSAAAAPAPEETAASILERLYGPPRVPSSLPSTAPSQAPRAEAAAGGRDFSKELFGEPPPGQASATSPSALPAVAPGVATSAEATQAVQRLRAKDFRRLGKGEKPALSVQQAQVSPQPATGSSQQTTTALAPSRQAVLSSDESESLELACFSAKSQGPAAYNACRSSHIAMLATAPPRPNLSQVSGDERESLELACFRAKSQGPARYNSCLQTQLSQLRGH
jgi:hypothetical protein